MPNIDPQKEVKPAVAPLLLKPVEAAKALAISPRKLWSLTAGGQIPCVRIGKCVRYDPADLRAWIDAQKQWSLAC
jgi:hypothetical protein